MKKLDHMKMSQPEIARIMRAEMKQRMLSPTDVARALGMTYDSAGQTVRRYLEGTTRASLKLNFRMVEWLNGLSDFTAEVPSGNGHSSVVLQEQSDIDKLADAVADRVILRLRKALAVVA